MWIFVSGNYVFSLLLQLSPVYKSLCNVNSPYNKAGATYLSGTAMAVLVFWLSSMFQF